LTRYSGEGRAISAVGAFSLEPRQLFGRRFGASTLLDPNPTAAVSSFGSLFGGFQLGYNYLLAPWLLGGVEGDISFPEFSR
jgi:hypothetical protein